MPTPTEELIAKYTVSGSSTTTYTFSSIPNSYTDLILVGSIATVTGSDTVAFRVNGDTTTNYSRTYMYGDGTTAASGRVLSESSYPVATLNTTFAPVVLPIQLPTANSVLNDVPAPVTVALLVAQVTLPVSATFGKLVVN